MFGLVPFYSRRGGLRPLFSEVENLFERLLNEDFFLVPVFGGHPVRADIRETEDAYLVEAELPGLEKDEIEVTYHEGVLTIGVKRQEAYEEKKESFLRRERRVGSFERRFYLEGAAVDEEKITATYKNGLLTVRLPKKEKKAPPGRKIAIE